MDARLTVIAGGVGAARFLQGVLAVVPPESVTILGNVGDDLEMYGLHVSPDLDTVLYTLTGQIDEDKGWGVRGDTSRALDRARELGAPAWFWLGDLDIGLHLARTERLRQGERLSDVTAEIAQALGLRARLLPVTDDRLRTIVETEAEEELEFQEYYVGRGHRDVVRGLRFDGAERARPAAGVLEALSETDAVFIAPSNPFISVAPVLAVPGVREALGEREVPCVAVSPIVAGEALRGPAAGMMRSLGHDVSPVGVARIYEGLIDVLVVDRADAELAPQIEALGVRVVVTDTIMRDAAAREALAREALDAAGAVHA
jgi:LPPG:FO 2-phospho-L-lactate transferase